MNAIDKLSAVVIQADTRISERDRTFCQTHQSAYQEAKISLMEIGAMYQDVTTHQTKLLSPNGDKTETGYISITDLMESKIQLAVEELHGTFISRIISHFNSTYHVSISVEPIIKKLLPQKPKDNSWDFEENKKISRQYRETVANLTVQYADILEEMFLQLDGRTFSEMALDELKEGCHEGAWSSYKKEPEYEVKGDTIRFSGYFCSYDTYGSSEYWSLQDSMRKILRGLAHYETGAFNIYPQGISSLLEYGSRRCNDMEFPSCTKVYSLKMFKNRRVDVKFRSREYAREFAAEYLGAVS